MNHHLALILLTVPILACAAPVVAITPVPAEPAQVATRQIVEPPDIPAPTPYLVAVTGDVVNVRDYPAGEVIGQVYAGTSLSVIAASYEFPNWLLIASGEHFGLWIWRGCTDAARELRCEAQN